MFKIKPLQWSEQIKPNTDIPYDHILAECALGRFSIEWKNWKEYPSISLDLNGTYFADANSIEHAKELAAAHVQKVVQELVCNVNLDEVFTLTHEEALSCIPTVTLKGQKPVTMAWLKQSDALVAVNNTRELLMKKLSN